MEKIEKFCIFCGSSPDEKTREHVIPQWLLEYTGDPKRQVFFGYDLKTGKERHFAADQFVFPACRSCNEAYGSGLEERVIPIIKALDRREGIASSDYDVLMDWLDKVRIGLWLGFKYLNKSSTSPNFHIDTRIGKKDRILFVYPYNSSAKGISYIGPGWLGFDLMPSCFLIRINSVALLNISYDFLISRNAGFPYPTKLVHELDMGGMMSVSDFKVREKIQTPLFAKRLFKPCVALYQPIILSDLHNRLLPMLRSEFFENVLIHPAGLKGKLLRDIQGNATYLPLTEIVEFDTITRQEAKRFGLICAQVFETENFLLEKIYAEQFSSSDPDAIRQVRKHYSMAITLNKNIICQYREMFRGNKR